MADAPDDYPYPPDQFDREAETTSFHGAHRAEEPFWRQNLLYIVVIAAAVLVLLGLLFAIGGMGGGKDDPTTSPTTTQAAPPASDAGGEPAAPQGDKTTPVLVVNAGGQKGMAGTWRDHLKSTGWTEVGIATAESRQEQPVVFYKDEADAATAQMLAQEAGVEGGAQQSDEYDARVTILVVNAPQG